MLLIPHFPQECFCYLLTNVWLFLQGGVGHIPRNHWPCSGPGRVNDSLCRLPTWYFMAFCTDFKSDKSINILSESVLVLCDLSAAFDTVDRLEMRVGLSGPVFSWSSSRVVLMCCCEFINHFFLFIKLAAASSQNETRWSCFHLFMAAHRWKTFLTTFKSKWKTDYLLHFYFLCWIWGTVTARSIIFCLFVYYL